MSKRPQTYRQWRSLWRSTLYEIGFVCLDEDRERKYARTLHRLRRRAARIKTRLDAEKDAFTSDYASALIEMVTKWSDQ